MRDSREQERVVRVVLPVKVIRQLDGALQESLGGFETRAEFIREAVENMLLELRYEPAQPELLPSLKGQEVVSRDGGADSSVAMGRTDDDHPVRQTSIAGLAADVRQPTPRANHTVADLPSLNATVLKAPPPGAVVEDGIAQIDDEPLFGLHNRDYPSIWAAHQLAELARDRPVPLADYLDEVTRRAWSYADALRPLEQQLNRKLSVMYPRNLRKPQSAEEGFRAFAVGSVTTRGGKGQPAASGPLFAWEACQLRLGDRLSIGLTDHGWELLEALDGISLDMPHPPKMAERFLAHLRKHAPGDWWGFETLLDAVAEEPDRTALLAHLKAARPDWSDAVVGTNSQGYVGRCREWGLVKPKQVQGRYLLTDFGRQIVKDCR